MEKIDFLKKGITDFFPNFFITFSKVQRNIFNEKSHSNRKTNLKVDLVSCVDHSDMEGMARPFYGVAKTQDLLHLNVIWYFDVI